MYCPHFNSFYVTQNQNGPKTEKHQYNFTFYEKKEEQHFFADVSFLSNHGL